jgi:hypothetical protein
LKAVIIVPLGDQVVQAALNACDLRFSKSASGTPAARPM